jgi:hypothetical protein
MLPDTAHKGRFSDLAQSLPPKIPEIRQSLRKRHVCIPQLAIPLLGLPSEKATMAGR